MPVLSPSRYTTPSSSTLSSGSYRSNISSSTYDRPYYSSSTGSYITSRSTGRSSYSTRTTSSYVSTEYRSNRFYDGDRKSSYTSEVTRRVRAPSISDSDSGISGVYATRSERSTSRSRDASASRSESSRTATRSDPLPRSYVSPTTAELFEKYSPSNYVPLSQRLSTSVTGEAARARAAAETARPPRRLRPHDSERQRGTPIVNSDKGRTTTPSTYIPRAKVSSAWNSDKTIKQLHNGYQRNGEMTVSDDNGNDLPLSVSEIRRKFDTKMTVTKLPSRTSDFLCKTAHSSDNIYGALRSSSLVDDKPVPVHKPTSSSEKYVNGTTGSLKWEFPSSASNRDNKNDSGYTIKQTIEPGSDISTIYIAGKMKTDVNAVKSQLNANNVIGKILEKSTTIYVGNGDNKNYGEEAPKHEKPEGGKNILSIEIGADVNSSKQTCNDLSNNAVEDKSAITPQLKKSIAMANHLENGSSSTEARPKHTSDFASYIQVSMPAPCSPPAGGQKRFFNTVCNGDISDDSSPDDITTIAQNELPSKNTTTVHLLSPDESGTTLRYIDSEPSLEADDKLFIDYNGKDDYSYEEEGFENKTFEHANGHLLRKGTDEVDYVRKTKTNGIRLADSQSDDEEEGNVRPGSRIKENDLNSNERYTSSSSSPPPDTPSSKRKYRELNGDATGSLYQIYQNDSLVNAKSTSPVNTLAPSFHSTSTNSTVNNSSSSPCGSLTTSRRRSIDSKSPQPSGDKLSKSSGLNGLRNIGNTCFMNSVVQCLSNTKPLLEYCGSPDAYTPHINTTLSCMKGALINAFSTVIRELWKADETDGVVNTTSLKSQIQRFAPRFMGYSQQDAQEFLRYLLEGLHEDVNRVTVKPKPILTEIDENLSDAQKAEESWQRYLRSEDSKVGDIFVGQLKSSLKCTHCMHTSVTFDPFWDLSLPIPSRTGQLKLTQCLSHFTREEELDGDEKPTCSKCQVRRKCLKWFTVQKFPRVLVLHLKRFSPTERFRGKLNVPVEFPLMNLDMTPYAADSAPGSRGPPPTPAIYNLYAVSNHSGTTYSGHYTAYCKHPYNGEWHEYNDSRVSPITQKNVISSEAYVLFYELANGSAPS